jgi:hypothetical protein
MLALLKANSLVGLQWKHLKIAIQSYSIGLRQGHSGSTELMIIL